MSRRALPTGDPELPEETGQHALAGHRVVRRQLLQDQLDQPRPLDLPLLNQDPHCHGEVARRAAMAREEVVVQQVGHQGVASQALEQGLARRTAGQPRPRERRPGRAGQSVVHRGSAQHAFVFRASLPSDTWLAASTKAATQSRSASCNSRTKATSPVWVR